VGGTSEERRFVFFGGGGCGGVANQRGEGTCPKTSSGWLVPPTTDSGKRGRARGEKEWLLNALRAIDKQRWTKMLFKRWMLFKSKGWRGKW